jgi:RNase P/RNase MRP subunit p29
MSELLELRLKSLDENQSVHTLPTEGALSRSERFAGMPSISAIQSKLLKADYHGAFMVGMHVSLHLPFQISSSPLSTSFLPLLRLRKTNKNVLVHKAKNPSLVDLQGIVIQESEQTFKLIQVDNKIKSQSACFRYFVFGKRFATLQLKLFLFCLSPLPVSIQKKKAIPKAHTIFQISLPLLEPPPAAPSTAQNETDNSGNTSFFVFQIFGNQFLFRPTERVNKKFKAKATSQL